jgi:hypothetical protein
MTLSELATVIRKDWKKPYFGAVPYIEAMAYCATVDTPYGCEDGKTQVIYFLSNANTWRGPVAKAVKAELKRQAGLK